MSFRAHHTLTGYARTAVDLKARMDEHVQGVGFREFLDTRLPTDQERRHSGRVADAVAQAAGTVWRAGEPFVLAPAMTAVVAARSRGAGPDRRGRHRPGGALRLGRAVPARADLPLKG